MLVVRPNGEAVDLPRPGRCLTGRVARRFLRRAASPREQAIRARQLLIFCGRLWWGLTWSEIAAALDLKKQTVQEQLGKIAVELLEVTDELEMPATAVFGDQVAFTGGEGI